MPQTEAIYIRPLDISEIFKQNSDKVTKVLNREITIHIEAYELCVNVKMVSSAPSPLQCTRRDKELHNISGQPVRRKMTIIWWLLT